MFYEGHITSLAARGKDDRQRQLYDDMFAKVNARFLHLMIRPTHEPQNDNADPWTPAFDLPTSNTARTLSPSSKPHVGGAQTSSCAASPVAQSRFASPIHPLPCR